jgi:hypothetical protein
MTNAETKDPLLQGFEAVTATDEVAEALARLQIPL